MASYAEAGLYFLSDILYIVLLVKLIDMTRQKFTSLIDKYKSEVYIGLLLLMLGGYYTLYGTVNMDTKRLDKLEAESVKAVELQEIENKLNDIDRKMDTVIFNQWKLAWKIQQHLK